MTVSAWVKTQRMNIRENGLERQYEPKEWEESCEILSPGQGKAVVLTSLSQLWLRDKYNPKLSQREQSIFQQAGGWE